MAHLCFPIRHRLGNRLSWRLRGVPLLTVAGGIFSLLATAHLAAAELDSSAPFANRNRSPVDIAISADGTWCVTANQTSHSASLVDLRSQRIIDEVHVGERPTAVTLGADGQHVLLSTSYGGDLVQLRVHEGRLTEVTRIHLGFQPHGIAATSTGEMALVALTDADAIAVVDLQTQAVVEQISVRRWPRYVALSPDEKRLAVGTSGDQGITIVDLENHTELFFKKVKALNIGHLQYTSDGSQVYFPWVIYRRNPITADAIRRGWVLATRVGRVYQDKATRAEAMSLDKRGEAVGDPHGLALTPDENTLAVTASGTQELLVFRVRDLPFLKNKGTDHIDGRLHADPERFRRIHLGGRPMGLRISADGQLAYVTNYLLNSIQIVDLTARKLFDSIPLGNQPETSLARRGESIFFDAKRSLDQWYSCHSCHYDGGTNATTMDTKNDGDKGFTFKTVLPLYDAVETAPWTWHGWQTDFAAAMRKSITSTMLGKEPSNEDVHALVAYLKTLKSPPNSLGSDERSADKAMTRGRDLFFSERAGCSNCHNGPYLTDGHNHDVGLNNESNEYQDFNTPSLKGVRRKTAFLHDGRATSLHELLEGPHAPEIVTGQGSLSQEELADLITFISSL